MKYYFAGAGAHFKLLQKHKIKRFLFSFASEKNCAVKFADTDDVILDSGAFSAWKSGMEINHEDYVGFCESLPSSWKFVCLDVIPKTGSTKREIDICIERSKENYSYMSSRIGNVIPVFHFGEPLDVLKWYMDRTDYIGLSPANDTTEVVKRQFLSSCFSVIRPPFKTHGFGYTNQQGLELFPFYSVDSIAYLTVVKSFRVSPPLEYFAIKKFSHILAHEMFVTELWKTRGVYWDE